jgi:major outer membrane protein
MRLFRWGIAALVLNLAAIISQSSVLAQTANDQDHYQSASNAAQTASVALPSYYSDEECDSCTSGECEGESYCSDCDFDCDSGCESSGSCGKLGGGFCSRPGQFFLGASYIYARADLSDALAYIEQDAVAGGDTYHQYDFNFNSSFSVDGGYRLCDCGGEIIFNYTRLQSDADFALADGAFTTIGAPYEVTAPAGGRLEGGSDIDLDSYYIGFSKTIPLGSPLGCVDTCTTCMDTCCDCGDMCGGGLCPAWDIKWSAGIRAAEVEWNHHNAAYDSQQVLDDFQTTRMDFEGIGGQFGLEGRRYIGRKGRFSLYARGDISLLVGTINIDTQSSINNGAASGFTRAKFNNIIPVTEFTVGGTMHIRDHFALSAGYFLSAWHDLGMRDEYHFNSPPLDTQQGHYDDANILGFDGLFVRGEMAF